MSAVLPGTGSFSICWRTALVACVAEPSASVLGSFGWFSSSSKLAAIFWLPQFLSSPVILIHKARDFVTIKVGDIYIASVYVSPNRDIVYFVEFLEDFKTFYLSIGCPVMILCGDFNARSHFWGDTVCDRRGDILEKWTAELDFRLCNVGNSFTCLRPQGSSIPDITWCSPSCLDQVSHWVVLSGMETWSDHAYISFRLRLGSAESSRSLVCLSYPRWSWKEFNKDLFNAAFEFKWGLMIPDFSSEEYASWLSKEMEQMCDLAAHRVGSRRARKSAYWWCEEIAVLRRKCVSWRRKWFRIRRDPDSVAYTYIKDNYLVAKREFRSSIKKAKARCWRELILSIDEDP